MHHDGTATAGRKGIPYDWHALVDEVRWEQIVTLLRDVDLERQLALAARDAAE